MKAADYETTFILFEINVNIAVGFSRSNQCIENRWATQGHAQKGGVQDPFLEICAAFIQKPQSSTQKLSFNDTKMYKIISFLPRNSFSRVHTLRRIYGGLTHLSTSNLPL